MPEINNMQKKMVYLFLDADPHRTINRSLLRQTNNYLIRVLNKCENAFATGDFNINFNVKTKIIFNRLLSFINTVPKN